MNPELIKIAQQLMQQNPGMTPEQALQAAQQMSQGEQSEGFVGGQAREAGRMGQMAQQQQQQRQQQRPPQRPQVQPGLLGGGQPTPQGQAPHPGIQRPQTPGLSGAKDAAWCASIGGTVQGGSCVIGLQL
jgi:hypothetical protein